jgi:CheY-like chemotaxis protein
MIIAIVNDVFFREMIQQEARNESKACLCLAEEEPLLSALQETTPEVFFLEIGFSAFDGAEIIQRLKRNPSTRKIPIVAFGNGLRADLLQDAKEAGADLVLVKAAFREQLPQIIRHYDKGHE